MKGHLSKELLDFIVLHVDSVELLEILILLYSQPSREWLVTDLDAVIRGNLISIKKRLEHLIHIGLVTENRRTPSGFRFNPQNQDLAIIGRDLVLAYQTRRVEITEMIYTKPMKEIVSFSNAFRIRGRKKKDG